MPSDARVHEVSRRLRARVEPIFGVVFHMPEAWAGYPDLGLDAAEGSLAGRAACLGRVPGVVAAAVFALLEPTRVTSAVDTAWSKIEPATMLQRRLDDATRYLAELIGGEPDGVDRAVALLRPAAETGTVAGHPVFAGLLAQDWPGFSLGDLWRACDLVREHRGASHVNAWTAAGLDPVEINVLSEAWRGMKPDTVTVWQLGWSRADAGAARERIAARGLLQDDGEITDAGRVLRDEIERTTSRQERSMVETLGDDVDELFALLEPWDRICDAAAPAAWAQPKA